jgi:kynurenine formamidase
MPFQTARDDIIKPGSTQIGVQAWANHGIVGRGVLIDYWEYAKKSYDPNTTHRITVKDILEVAKLQKVEFQYGDILIIRSGWVETYHKLDFQARDAIAKAHLRPTFVGVEQTDEMLDFLHDNYFSAVAGDTPAFEAWPTNQDWFCHQFLLPLWGVPIGEMWDLEKLAETCKERGAYSFYFSSIPTNVPGKPLCP